MLNLLFSGLMLVVSVIANLALAPRWGSAGTAWATLATEASLSTCCLIAVARARRRDRADSGGGASR
jgi:O-antigen/teichoic acid export membrane protein